MVLTHFSLTGPGRFFSGVCASITRSATGCGWCWIIGRSISISYCAAARKDGNNSTPHPTLSPSEAERAREAKQAEADYERARTQADKDYEETAAAVADKKQLTPDEEAELNRLWKKRWVARATCPSRRATGPEEWERASFGTGGGEKLWLHSRSARQVAARYRQVARATHTDEIELAQLRRLHPAPAGLQLEIVAVIESFSA